MEGADSGRRRRRCRYGEEADGRGQQEGIDQQQ